MHARSSSASKHASTQARKHASTHAAAADRRAPRVVRQILWLGQGGPAKDRLWVADETMGLSEERMVHEYKFYVDMTGDSPRLDVTLVW
jgi:hypothetical protein